MIISVVLQYTMMYHLKHQKHKSKHTPDEIPELYMEKQFQR